MLLKDQYLGRGAYGVVYKAKCDQLVCAAKYLHPTFFETNDPNERSAVDSFRVECEMLRQLHHPNIVQYLGTHQGELGDTKTVVLLMEEMDRSLHAFLATQKQSALPLHREVDLMFDISLAMDYLHANDIYHRDLSSKNVLLKGDKAKVSDFGVAKLRDPNAGYSSDTPCPGNPNYMPPEVMSIPPEFDKSLDEFSMGVIMIEIMTRKEPQPTALHVKRGENVLEIIPEVIRREGDLHLCNRLNPLVPIALCCISNNPSERPLANQISRLLSLLQTTTEYRNSTTSRDHRTHSECDPDSIFGDIVTIEIDDSNGLLQEIKDLRKRLAEKDDKISEQQQLLSIREGQLKENHARAQMNEENFEEVRRRMQQQTEIIQEKDRILQDCRSKLNSKSHVVVELENSVRSNKTSLEVLRFQQQEVDRHVGEYITQIDVLQSHVSELELENRALKHQLSSKDSELRRKCAEVQDTRARLIDRERELVNATLKGLQSLKPSEKKRR